MNEQELEQEIEYVTHVTKGEILIWAVIATASGYDVVGKYAVVGKPPSAVFEENYDKDLGEKTALNQSRDELLKKRFLTRLKS